jgi:hypothetical protein
MYMSNGVIHIQRPIQFVLDAAAWSLRYVYVLLSSSRGKYTTVTDGGNDGKDSDWITLSNVRSNSFAFVVPMETVRIRVGCVFCVYPVLYTAIKLAFARPIN